MAKITERKQKWWSSLTDECPITLEPLSALPYPPFILTDRATGGNKKSAGGVKKGCSYHFDGLALATYIVSQGAFANPLTREPLNYEDCVHLDDYLTEHIYQQQNHQQEHYFSVLGQRKQTICVKEAWLLRDSIKVKVDGSGSHHQNESQRRRAEALRNEASAALRGLFVFGHHSENQYGRRDDDWASLGQMPNSQSLSRAPGGFNLHHNLNSNSSNQQEGLCVVDDDEAAYEAADVAAWRGLQEEFPTLPHLNGDGVPQQIHNSDCDSNDPDQMLETVRQTATLTIKEEKEKAERVKRNRQRYFLQALERKKGSIDARRKSKEEAASVLSREKEAEGVLQSARDEIDQWRAQQWEEWECVASIHKSKTKTEYAGNMKTSPDTNEPKHDKQQSTASQNEELTAEEKAAKAAAKKKAKRQKAKERDKEKKRIEKLESEKKERALAIQKEKENSAVKCGACGQGILGRGFEKYGRNFCSTKCARGGPSS